MFFGHHFQRLKQKVFLHLESLAQLNNLSFDFLLNNSGFARYLFQFIFLSKPDFNCDNDFALSWVDRVTTGT